LYSACTKEDILVAYGICENNARDILFYTPNTCDVPETFKVPAALRNKPCDFTCHEGEYYDTTSNKCVTCPDGTTSKSHGLKYSTWFGNLFIFFESFFFLGKQFQKNFYWKLIGMGRSGLLVIITLRQASKAH
jgi:hypothetical protein